MKYQGSQKSPHLKVFLHSLGIIPASFKKIQTFLLLRCSSPEHNNSQLEQFFPKFSHDTIDWLSLAIWACWCNQWTTMESQLRLIFCSFAVMLLMFGLEEKVRARSTLYFFQELKTYEKYRQWISTHATECRPTRVCFRRRISASQQYRLTNWSLHKWSNSFHNRCEKNASETVSLLKLQIKIFREKNMRQDARFFTKFPFCGGWNKTWRLATHKVIYEKLNRKRN